MIAPASDPPALGEAASFLPEREFELACRLINEYAGIKLGPHKRYMVHNRLTRRLRVRGMDSFADYMRLVENDVAGEREAFVNALTTNLTAFFREPHHFELQALKLLGLALRFTLTGHHLLDHGATSQLTDYDQRKQRFDHRRDQLICWCAFSTSPATHRTAP